MAKMLSGNQLQAQLDPDAQKLLADLVSPSRLCFLPCPLFPRWAVFMCNKDESQKLRLHDYILAA